jgi:hypothetical protein
MNNRRRDRGWGIERPLLRGGSVRRFSGPAWRRAGGALRRLKILRNLLEAETEPMEDGSDDDEGVEGSRDRCGSVVLQPLRILYCGGS